MKLKILISIFSTQKSLQEKWWKFYRTIVRRAPIFDPRRTLHKTCPIDLSIETVSIGNSTDA